MPSSSNELPVSGTPVAVLQSSAKIVLLSKVTAPLRARALPSNVAPVFRVMAEAGFWIHDCLNFHGALYQSQAREIRLGGRHHTKSREGVCRQHSRLEL